MPNSRISNLPIPAIPYEEMVFISQTNQVMTDSLLIAKFFGKRHDNVIQKIKKLDCSQDFTNLNFKVCHKNNELQNNKLQPLYQMTKDGFIFLVMGFTGRKAALIKESYINAFNMMFEKLNKQTPSTQDFNPNLYKDFIDLKDHVNFKMVITVKSGKPQPAKYLNGDEFVANKENIISLMKDSHCFNYQDIIEILKVATSRVAEHQLKGEVSC